MTNFREDIWFFVCFHLKFTICANYEYLSLDAEFSEFILCLNHHGQANRNHLNSLLF